MNFNNIFLIIMQLCNLKKKKRIEKEHLNLLYINIDLF